MSRLRRLLTPRVVAQVLAWTAVWLVLTVLVGTAIFLQSSRTIVLASHDAVLRPTLSGYVEVRTGPVLPDVRVPSGQRVGVDVYLGKTEVESTEALIERYAVIASQPDGQRAKAEDALRAMAVNALLRGAVVALIPMGLWFLLGKRRRAELGHRLRNPVIASVTGLLVVGVLVVWEPWEGEDRTVESDRDWQSLEDFLGGVSVPAEVEDLELRGDVTTQETRRLVESAIDTYDKSLEFYQTAAEQAATLDLRVPEEGDTVVALISDRHDNVGMDAVARAIADRGAATAVFDAGDDTSVGQPWEAFSLDSVNEAFDDLARYGVAGNHDHGTFVASYLSDLGWTMLDGEPIEGPGGIVLLGVDDPRSSGLGSWRDETGLSYAEVGSRLADAVVRRTGPGQHAAGPRPDPGPRGARARLRRPGRGRPPARPARPGAVRRTRRRDRLQLHQRHHRRRGVRDRARQQAAALRRRGAGDLPRRRAAGHPERHPAD